MTRAGHPDDTPGPIVRLLGLFDSVTLGIVLMVLLFIYCTIGSAGIFYPEGGSFLELGAWKYDQLRTFRGLEMTEYEWFNWWPFDVLIGMICLTLTVVTLRRIRLNAINLGVWMIHSGILILCAGSVWYFGTKVEGDTPVMRRQVQITTPSGQAVTLRAVPGAGGAVGGWRFDVIGVDPDYTMLSGPDEGSLDFSVTVSVEPPSGSPFMRQLLARHPENTEDIVRTGDPSQPMARAVKLFGEPLVDTSLQMSLEYLPQDYFYLANWVEKSWALYVREVFPGGRTGPWAQRPIHDGMPLYNDYLASPDDVWFAPGHGATPDMLDPLDAVAVGTEPHDPLGAVPIRITSYLRYASFESRRIPGGAVLDPAVTVRLEDRQHAATFDLELAAYHPDEQMDDVGVEFVWANTLEQRAALAEVRAPRLQFSGPGLDAPYAVPVREVSLQTPDLPFRPVPGTGYEYRVEFVQDLGPQGVLASVELRTGQRHFRRWVFDPEHAALTMDVSLSAAPEVDHDDHTGHNHAPDLIPEETYPLDPGLVVSFDPGNDPARALLLGGPGEEDLGVVLRLGSPQDGTYLPLLPGEPVSLGGERSLTVMSFTARSHVEERPLLVPLSERRRDAQEKRSMVRFQFTTGGQALSDWAQYHDYVFDGSDNARIRFHPALRRYPFLPTAVDLPDGRRVELMLSRQRLPLPAPVVLDDFELSSHVGGFSGQVTSIMNWTSQIRFEQGTGWTPTMPVTVNAPAEHEGLWYFQAAWDPPEQARFSGQPDSKGLNYTVLGVGNRNGVRVQLFGCIVAVLGMLYAFYVKPQLIRRRRNAQESPA
jgi:hypothetical protein